MVTVTARKSRSRKITRDAFLYMDPHANSDRDQFAQCSTCRMFVPESAMRGVEAAGAGARCVAFGSKPKVAATGSCGSYLIWPSGSPNAEAIAGHAAELKRGSPGSTTPAEAGYVDRPVRCENCRYFKEKVSRCGLYEKLNAAMPEYFELDTFVDKHGCCNGNEAR